MSGETTERTVSSWEIEDHGVHHPQYFQGAGISFTSWEEIGTGIGHSPGEALADALDILALAGWSVSDEDEERMLQEIGPEYAERNTVSEEIEDALPPLSWTVLSGSWSGLSGIPETYETEEDARADIAGRLRLARSHGLSVGSVDGSSWEIHEPEDAALVPDLAGWIRLSSNEDEREDIQERAELFHYLSVRVRSEEVQS